MHGPITLASLILVLATVGATDRTIQAAPAPVPISQRVAEARRALADKHPVAAIGTLEAALTDPNLATAGDRLTVLSLLRQSYELAADQADAAGRPLDADSFRENARILSRKSAPSSRPVSAPVEPPVLVASPTPATVEVPAIAVEAPPLETSDPLAGLIPGGKEATIRPASPEPVTHSPEPTVPRVALAPADRSESVRASLAVEKPIGPGLAEADAAFRAEKYSEAGRIYTSLAQENHLPEERRQHWAYCRSHEVARQISARPKTEAEWQQIDAEIVQIRALAPDNYLGRYLQDKAASRSLKRQASRASSTVIRAASPEEPPVRPSAKPVPAANPEVETTATPVVQPTSGVPVGRWQILESAHFRVSHLNPKLAEQVIKVAEKVRRDQTRRWSGSLPPAPWQPKCEIYLYPSAQQYAQMTGQPADSPGFSTMGMNEGQVISRRVSLRTDHDGLLLAVLPHEVTHVILADFFPDQQIPRWADEGMAVLTEPVAEQQRRATDLVDPLNKNLLFTMTDLMNMDYPDNAYWSLYYAQSVSLTRFLVEQGTPAQFIQFLQGSQKRGVEAELRRTYKIDGFQDLQARWVVYARANIDGNAPTTTASNALRGETRAR